MRYGFTSFPCLRPDAQQRPGLGFQQAPSFRIADRGGERLRAESAAAPNGTSEYFESRASHSQVGRVASVGGARNTSTAILVKRNLGGSVCQEPASDRDARERSTDCVQPCAGFGPRRGVWGRADESANVAGCARERNTCVARASGGVCQPAQCNVADSPGSDEPPMTARGRSAWSWLQQDAVVLPTVSKGRDDRAIMANSRGRHDRRGVDVAADTLTLTGGP